MPDLSRLEPSLAREIVEHYGGSTYRAMRLLEDDRRINNPSIDYPAFAQFTHDHGGGSDGPEPVMLYPEQIFQYANVTDAVIVYWKSEDHRIWHVGWLVEPRVVSCVRNADVGTRIPLRPTDHVLRVLEFRSPTDMAPMEIVTVERLYAQADSSSGRPRRVSVKGVQASERSIEALMENVIAPIPLSPTEARRYDFEHRMRSLGQVRAGPVQRCSFEELAASMPYSSGVRRSSLSEQLRLQRIRREAPSFDAWLKEAGEIIDGHKQRQAAPDWAEPLEKL